MFKLLRPICSILYFCFISMATASDDRLQNHLDALREAGQEPIAFINQTLQEHDLIVFDDALHNTYDAWAFFGDLVKDKDIVRELDYVFIEVISRKYNDVIQEYLTAKEDDPRILIPAFTNDLHGYGWSYNNTLDFIKTVRAVNLKLPEEDRIKVIGVEPPTYWESLHMQEDWLQHSEFFAQIYDFAMYRYIYQHMDSFKKGKKAFFFTNTRHAYTNVHHADGSLYWNATTYFTQRHPGKAFSLRVHNASLNLTVNEEGKRNIAWGRIAAGLWDSAFAANGNVPVAVPLVGTPFGKASYMGNHQFDVQKGSTMQNAYDAIVFLAPLEMLQQCGNTDLIYTDEFKKELERRLPIRFGKEELESMMAEEGVDDVRQYIDKVYVASKPAPQSQTRANVIGPIDAWEKKVEEK